MNASTSILFWNVRAIALLKEGEFSLAVATLKKALDELRVSMRNAPANRDGGMEQIEASFPAARSISIIDEDANIDTDSNQLFDMYPKAFELPVGTSKQCAVVAILYNLALVFDIKSLSTSNVNDMHCSQDRAMDLYSTALKVASTSWTRADMMAMASVTLAIVNNLGRLQSCRCSFVDTRYLMKLSMDLLNSPSARSHMLDSDRLQLSSSIAAFICLGDSVLTNAPCA